MGVPIPDQAARLARVLELPVEKLLDEVPELQASSLPGAPQP